MIYLILRLFIIIIGGFLGFQVQKGFSGVYVGVGVSFIIVMLELIISKIKLDTLVTGVIGLVLGIVSAQVLDYVIFLLEEPTLMEGFKKYLWVIRIGLGYLGLVIALQKKSELDLLDKDIIKKDKSSQNSLVVLDTSMIIDGRIVDIYETKFITGPMLVPKFVLRELQYLADSQDHNKRLRAKRGLEMLSKLKEDRAISVLEIDYPEIKETDAKLIKLGKDLGAKILTVDYNLNKVASLEGVIVLNINDLANALKPIFLPGECFTIFILKEGKDHNQGIGYLDDGTMVVVEDGRKFIGKKVDVVVNSTLQTSSGRIIFTKPT